MATRESLETLGSDKFQTRESLETLGSDKVQTGESLETLGSNAKSSFFSSFDSHIYTKPTAQSAYDVASIYKVTDNKNALLKLSDLQKVSVDEKNIFLNYNKFILSIGSEFDIKLGVSNRKFDKFKNIVEKMFEFYYENNLETTFSTETTEQNFTFANLFASGNLVKSQLLDCSVAALSLESGTLSIRFPIGFVINKYNGKKDSQSTIDAPLQKFFISLNDINYANSAPVTNGIFYDSQIAVDGTYSYFVQTVDLIINYAKDVPQSVTFITEYKEQNFSSYDASVPPMSPSVDIRNYANVNNKLLILLNVNEGSDAFKAKDINLFTQKQKDLFAKIYKDKGINYPNNDYIFSYSQNQERFFLVYRIDSRPTSYDQIILEKNIIKKLDIQKLENSFDDKISPNKKYYYCFLVQDSSGILSDASLVYETEMVDQGGTVYLKQSAFIPELKTNFISAKDFQDRVRIFPIDAQINIPDKLQQYVELIYDGDDNKYNLAYPGVLDFISNKLGFKSKTVKTPVITQEFIPPLLQQTPIVITQEFIPPLLQAQGAQFTGQSQVTESEEIAAQAGPQIQQNAANELPPKFVTTLDLLSVNPVLLGFSLELEPSEAGQEINTIAETLKNKVLKFVTAEQAQENFEKFLQDNFAFFSKTTQGNNTVWSDIASDRLKNKTLDSNKEMEFLSEQIKQLFSYIVKNPNEPLTIQKQNSLEILVTKFFEIASTLLFINILTVKFTYNKKLSEVILPLETMFSNNNNVVYKVRVESQNSKKKFDLNITYNLQISEKIQLLQNSGITKQFEVLKSEPY